MQIINAFLYTFFKNNVLVKTKNTAVQFNATLITYLVYKVVGELVKGKLSYSFTNYNYVGNTKVSVSIKKT